MLNIHGSYRITKKELVAKWSDLIPLYNEESKSICKLTKIDHQTLWPNNFEKQNVHLVCNVFNEKVFNLLKQRKCEGTSIFIERVTQMWNILNVRSPEAGKQLNDKDRIPFEDENDERSTFLTEMATVFKLMDSSKQGQRVKALTGDTSNALHVTLLGMVDLIKTLLQHGHKYVLPGKIQSDRVEGEFGIYRQNSGREGTISSPSIK